MRFTGAAYSTDGCRTWSKLRIISQPPAGGHAAYPVACQTPKGTIVVVWYEGDPRTEAPPRSFHIRYARFNGEWLTAPKPLKEETE